MHGRVNRAKAVEHVFIPSPAAVRRELIYGSIPLLLQGRPIQISSTVSGKTGLWITNALWAANELVEHSLSLGLRWTSGKSGGQWPTEGSLQVWATPRSDEHHWCVLAQHFINLPHDSLGPLD